MGLNHVLTLLPFIAAPLAHAQTTSATTPNAFVSAPPYTPEQCSKWVSTLISADDDSSNGLSEEEYYSFLSSIVEPPYISEYFRSYGGFDQLPWVFRVVHKSLACHCEKLGLGGKCCEGDNAEVLLLGLDDSNTLRTSEYDEYKDLFCQQVSYVLTNSVSSPAPTAGPSERPTELPSANTSTSPSSANPTTSPVKGPTNSPVEEPTAKPELATPIPPQPTVAPSDLPSASPSASPNKQAVLPEVNTEGIGGNREEDGSGIATSGIIIIAIIVVLIATIVIVAYRRRKNEEAQLKTFAGEHAPEADLEAPVIAAEVAEQVPAPETPIVSVPAEEQEEDDESLAPSVWSESEDEDTVGELHEDHDDPGVTAGSALAAMGAASTVTARISASPGVV